MVHARLARQPGVDHDPHPGHRQARLGHRGRQDDPAPGSTAPEHRVLHRRRGLPVQLQHVGVQVGQLPGHPGDLADPGQEAQHIAPGHLGQRPPHRRRHMAEERRIDPHPVRRPYPARRRGVVDGHRVHPALGGDHRGVVQQRRPRLYVGRRRSRHQPQIGPQGGPYVQQEGHRGVRVEMPLMALVEQDDIHPGQFLVPLQPLQQHARGHHLDHRVPGDPALTAHGESDPPAGLLAQQPRHPPGRRPRRHAPGLGDQHPHPRLGERQRHQRRLARSRRRGQRGAAVGLQRPQQVRDGRAHRQIGQLGGGAARGHPATQTKIAVPGSSAPRSGDQPPHSWRFQSGHSGSTRSTSRKPHGGDLPDPVAQGAVVLDVHRPPGLVLLDVRRAVEVGGRRRQPLRARLVRERPAHGVRDGEDPPPAGPQDTTHLAHDLRGVGDERQRAVRRARQVEGGVRERQRARVGLDEGEVAADAPAVLQLPVGEVERDRPRAARGEPARALGGSRRRSPAPTDP